MIEVQQLTKRYGPQTAVDSLTFSVRPGSVTGFLGPNGAGKSTTIRLLLALTTPTSGRALVNGRPYQTLREPLREAGALVDAAGLHGGRTAYRHLHWLAASNGLDRRRVDEVLDRAGLSSVAGRRVRGFSLGMRQRLGIAAALLGDPPTLILDEPVNGLDPEGVHWIRGLMRGLAAEGRTILVSSHLISELALAADRLVVLGGGRLLADETVEAFSDGYATLEDAYFARTAGAVAYRSDGAR
ncbi:ATP-binding cassette domain-containing protein [Dactylosporangium sp. NPDC051485]|uniref:ABC transporter ATP-binding protein n=1 Tax=Dactylosporangium sp. NPDC051485 TaxID=3154846 RepID=UPI003418610F